MLYNRGMINAMLGVEAIRTRAGEVRQEAADRRAGALGPREPRSRPARRLKQLGFDGLDEADQASPATTTKGVALARIAAPGTARSGTFSSDWYTADEQVIKPMVKAAADEVRAEKKLTRRATDAEGWPAT